VSKDISEHEGPLGSIPAAGTFQPIMSHCLQLLNPYSPGTVLYILDCLCPYEVAVLDLVHLDLSQPHQHKRLSEKDVRLRPDSYEELLSHFRAYTRIVPAKDYLHFWLELTRSWLLTCPIDPDYYQDDETGKDLFCQKLRSELIDRILKIS
jgi:hypothetical protein